MRPLNGFGNSLSLVMPLSYTETFTHSTSQSDIDEYTPWPLPGS